MPEDVREAEARRRREEGDRVRQIRDSLNDNQPEFAARLNAMARQLGMGWLNYDNTALSRLENAKGSFLTVDDLSVLVSVAKEAKQRDVVWLAGITTPRRSAGGPNYRRRGGEDGKEESA